MDGVAVLEFHRNVAFGRFSTTSPCISMTSSFGISGPAGLT